VRAMQAIWTQDEASFDGEHVSFERIWSWPKPLQRPHPPVLVGGHGPTVLDRVLEYGDAWMPNPERDDDVLVARIAELRRRAADAGRTIGVTVNAASTRPERLERLVEAGVERAVFYLPSAGSEAIEARLASIGSAIATLRGS
jgi:alkanesulfonate monooxygenase SsuD/methylene tetrahydromethanopterin reductase-like flavin-dependent oxidoreductase (luciferase family)